ncbi:MAG: DUF364 domain-containing protein [Tissierellia bacterium]|nr:DUF364 domain-containing protein [Tissierellia bacterium]
MDIYEKLREEFKRIMEEEGLEKEEVLVHIGQLTPEESIGVTKRQDFPLLNGKEQMVQAEFRGEQGQAFTSSRAGFSGTLQEISNLDLTDDYNKAVFISTLNAVMKSLKMIDRTVHCRNEEPEECAMELADFVKNQYTNQNIGFVGYQPAMIENLGKQDLPLRVLDLNPEHIGHKRYGVLIEDGIKDFDAVVQWADILLVTGSTLCNGSIVNFLSLDIPVIFYGNTIAGAAHLLDLPRLCFKAH